MALLLRNTRPYLFPLLRGSRPAGALSCKAFSSGRTKVSFRSPTSLNFRSDGASGEGRFDEGITAKLTTSASPTTAPHDHAYGTVNTLYEELEDYEDGFDYENADYGFTRTDPEMAQDIVVTFLGTSSGGGPTKTRNCSSLVVDMLGDGSLWSMCYLSI